MIAPLVRLAEEAPVGPVLVTGGCGFIGSHLVDALLARGAAVRVLDDLSTGRAERCPPGATLLRGDVSDPETVRAAMSGVSACFHLAAVASVQRCTQDWLGTHRVNLGGTIAVLDAARPAEGHAPVPVVYASSSAIYGACTAPLISERERPAPLSAYGADKLGCELHATVAAGYGVPTLGLRFFNVYGPRQDGSSPYSGVISIFRERVGRGLALRVDGDGGQTRDFVHVSDVVRALLAGMDGLRAGRALPPACNVCTGTASSIATLARLLAGPDGRIEHGPPRQGDVPRSCGDPSLMASALDLRAAVSLEAGLRTLVE